MQQADQVGWPYRSEYRKDDIVVRISLDKVDIVVLDIVARNIVGYRGHPQTAKPPVTISPPNTSQDVTELLLQVIVSSFPVFEQQAQFPLFKVRFRV